MISLGTQLSSEKIKCPNCNKNISKPILYSCCYMVICQQCFDRQHYLNCNSFSDQIQLENNLLSNKKIVKEQINVCQRCCDKQQFYFCKNCQIKLCEQCNKKIHEKGKYALHKQQKLNKYCQLQVINNMLHHQRNKSPQHCFQNEQFEEEKIRLKLLISKFKERQINQLLSLNIIEEKWKSQYNKICQTIKEKFQTNQKLIMQSKRNISKQISQNLSKLNKSLIQIEAIDHILQKIEISQKTNFLNLRIKHLKVVNLKVEKTISQFPILNFQLKSSQLQNSLNSLIKYFAINKVKNVADEIFHNKSQNLASIRNSQNCLAEKESRGSSKLSSNRLNSVSRKSVTKFRKTQEKQDTTSKKSRFSSNFNQKNQMYQSYKVDLKKQFQKQKKEKDVQIKNRSNSFSNQINQIQKTQHHPLNLDLNKLNNKFQKASQKNKLQFFLNEFQNNNEKSSGKELKQPRSNKFLQNSAENRSVSKKKDKIKCNYPSNITKLSIKKELFQQKTKQNKSLIKTRSSRNSSSIKRKCPISNQYQEKQEKNSNRQVLGNKISDFEELSKQIDLKYKNKLEYQQAQNLNLKNSSHNFQQHLTEDIKIDGQEKLINLNSNTENLKKNEKKSIIQQKQPIKQNNCIAKEAKDAMKENKNFSYVNKQNKKSDLLNIRDMMRKPNIVVRPNLTEKNLKNK